MLLPLVLTTVTFVGVDPAPPETLPAPREVKPAEQSIVVPTFYRRSHYAVWQVTAPDFQGIWRPRVDFVPGAGFYYMYNGHPFYWDATHQTWYQPSVAGTPYRSYAPVYYILPAPVETPIPAKPQTEK